LASVRDRGPSIRSTPRSKRPSFRHEAWPTDRSLRPSQNRRSTDPGVEIDLWGPTAGFGPYPGPRPHNPVSPSLWLRRISSFSSGTCRTATARGPGRTKRWPGELSSQSGAHGLPPPFDSAASRACHMFVRILARARFLWENSSIPRARPTHLPDHTAAVLQSALPERLRFVFLFCSLHAGAVALRSLASASDRDEFRLDLDCSRTESMAAVIGALV
jgi:hypothetical protein